MMDLRAERLNRGLSVRELAQRLEISTKVIERAEAHIGRPHPPNAKKIADFYGVKVTDLWPLDNDEPVAA